MTYVELVEKAREIYESEDTPHVVKAWLLTNIIYPTDESEDERIRGAIIDHLKDNNLTEWAAWIKKQGEKNINHIDIKEKAHQIAWETSKDYDPLLSKEAWCEMAALDMVSWLKKQCEQKQTWKPTAAQLIVIKDLIEDKNTSKVNKVVLRGMFDEFKQYFRL